MKEMVDILEECFGRDEPILASDIAEAFPDLPRRTLHERISRAIEKGNLVRYEQGVYYIPSSGVLGQSELSPIKVIIRKYLRSASGERCGFWSGATLDNALGISEQVPNSYEVVTDNTAVAQRTITVGGYVKCVVRKSRVPAASTSEAALQLLDVLSRRRPATLDAEQRSKLAGLCKGLDKAELMRLSLSYPQKTTRRLVESEAIGVLA